MKNKYKILSAIIGIASFFTACTPNDYSLGGLIGQSSLKFSVTPNAQDPNMIILKSLTPGVTPLWITPIGRSTRVQDTVKIAFPGTYKFIYGVESAGGYVQSKDTVILNITTTNLSYVNDPLWTMLSGGVGQSKTWYLDLNASAVSKYFAGPLYFYGTNDSWESVSNGVKVGGDSWNWCPDYPGNSWLMTAADFGSMIFDLIGGAHITVDHKTIPARGVEHGTYMLFQDSHTLQLTDAAILHDTGRDGVVLKWGDIKVLSLTDNTMQLAVLRDNSSEGKCLLCYNFISKDYSDNWVPKTVSYGEPINSNVTQTDLVGTWRYSTVSQNWVGWEVQGSGKGGSQLNNWFTRADMVKDLLSWGATDPATTFANADQNLYTFNANGTCTLNGIANTYTVANGVISFGTPLAGTEWSLVWISLTGSSVNVLNVTSIGTTPYTSNGIWLGIRNGTKNEDQAIHLVKQ